MAANGGLSPRECEVLALAARGRCNKEIASTLSISTKTVDYFWKRIFKKLGCGSHVEVMALLLDYACKTV